MLFYLVTDKSGIEMIPDSYLVINVSRTLKCMHPNSKQLLDFLPKYNVSKDLEKIKKSYKHKLKDNKDKLAVIASTLEKNPHSESIVFVMSKKDKEEYGFNYVKMICKYLTKRYGYENFEFTNCATRDMREASKFTDEGKQQLVIDMSNVLKEVKKERC